MLLEHLLKPNLGIDTSVYTIVEPSRLMLTLGHAVNDLAAIGIRKCTDVPRHFELLGVVPLIDSG